MVWNDTRAQSIQIGAVLLFGIIIILLASWQAFGIPNQNEGIEFNHNQEVQQQLTELRTTAIAMVEASATRSATVNLGVRYPSRTLFVNPPPPAGTLRTAGTTDPSVNISITNITAQGEIGDFWNGSTRSFNTGLIEYRPRYNVYNNAPTTVYGQTVLYNEFTSGQTLSLTDQALLDGDQLSLITLNGSLTANRIDSASIDISPIHTQTETVEVQTEDNITLTLPSRLEVEQWRELLADEPRFVNATAVTDGIRITLAPGEYDLQLAKIGFGQGTTRDGAAYITDQNGRSFTTTGTEPQLITVETRNTYNDRVNATVTAQLTQGSGEIQREQAGGGGEYTYRYRPSETSAGETAQIRFTLAQNDTPPDVAVAPAARNVTTTVNVTAPGNGTATQPEYVIQWDENASSTRFIAGGDSADLVYRIQNRPQLTGSANFAIEDQRIGTLRNYTQTFVDGGGTVTFNSDQSGTTRVIASSGTSQDTLNLTVFPEPAQANVTANITTLNLDNEYVTFTYTGEPVSTDGWILHDDGRNFEFTFPRQVLVSGDTVVVTTNRTPESAVPDADYRFNWEINSPVWNNGGDIATLRDASDRQIDTLANGTNPGPTTYSINSINAVASGGNSINVTVNYTTDDPNAEIVVRTVRRNGKQRDQNTVAVDGTGTREQTISVEGQNNAERIVVILRDGNGNEETRQTTSTP